MELTLGEGGTPLIRANNLGMMLGCPNLYVKDERQGPTASFKDRQAVITIAALKEAGITELVIASTGNVAISYSAYAARASIKLWAFLTSLVPAAKMREVAIYGTQVIKITGSYDQAKKVASEFAHQRGLSIDQGARTIPVHRGHENHRLRARRAAHPPVGPRRDHPLARPRLVHPGRFRRHGPDWRHQRLQRAQGDGLGGQNPQNRRHPGRRLRPHGPRLEAKPDTAIPVQSPRTHIATLATGDPGRTYTLLRQKMLEASGGVIESVSDEEAFRAMHYLAKMEGMSVEPASAVAFAGLVKLVRAGIIKSHETVVINCTGHTMPIERNILGEGWSRDIVFPQDGMEESQEEGLLAALSKVAIDRFPRIAIVDDNPDVRRLIRRILQSQGNYTLFEATNGREAVELVQREHPNLIILDLMMPEMDGFAVMDELKNSPTQPTSPSLWSPPKN